MLVKGASMDDETLFKRFPFGPVAYLCRSKCAFKPLGLRSRHSERFLRSALQTVERVAFIRIHATYSKAFR
jgi:hypothetical protein